MTILDETKSVLGELKDLMQRIRAGSKQKDISSKEDIVKVRKTLLKLRRSHAKLREFQQSESKSLTDTISRFQKAKSEYENARFVEAQCQFLVEKFNSAECPELDKISSSLPSIEEYTKAHSSDPSFVSYESDRHQFMLSLLASELTERKNLEQSIAELASVRDHVKGEILKKQKFLQSISSKLTDLGKSVDSIRSMFPQENLTTPEIATLERRHSIPLSSSPKLLVLVEKLNSLMDPHISIKTDDLDSVSVDVSMLPSAILPANCSRSVTIRFSPSIASCDDLRSYMSDIFKIAMDANESIGYLVARIRQIFMFRAWRDWEIRELETTRQVCTNTWFEDGNSGDWKLMSFSNSQAIIACGGSKVTVDLDMKNLLIRLERLLGGVKNVSAIVIGNSNEDETPVIVDIELANIAEEVNEWWNLRRRELGEFVLGETSGVISKCASLLSRII